MEQLDKQIEIHKHNITQLNLSFKQNQNNTLEQNNINNKIYQENLFISSLLKIKSNFDKNKDTNIININNKNNNSNFKDEKTNEDEKMGVGENPKKNYQNQKI